MGIGRLVGGKFNLVLSIRYDASMTMINEWQAAWQRASELLFDATDGQHQLGNVYVCNRSSGGRNADAWLLSTEVGDSSTNGWHEIGHETFHMTLFGEERFRPFVLVHEFGHYAYGCDDEYKGPTQQSDLLCIVDPSSNACIMQGKVTDGDRLGTNGTGGPFIRGRIRAFCVPSNHRTSTPVTNQQARYSRSCWETMVANFPTLTLPAGLPAGPGARVPDPINWQVLVPEQRFVLVLDRSGSMAGQKIEETKIGTRYWADSVAVGDRLGVVSFGSSAAPDFPLRAISGPPDRAAARAAIDTVMAGGSTSIGAGLRTALNQIIAAPRAATQVAVLVSDGFQNSGESPSAVVPDLVTNGVRVYTIGVGPDIDIPLLTNIANLTGGSFRRIDPGQSAARQATDIRDELIRISALAHDNGGVVTTIPERPETEPQERQVHTAFIEPGSELASFTVSWPGREDRVELEIVAPDGTTIGRGTTNPGVHEISGDDPYMGFAVAQPEPGDWTLLLTPERISNPEPFALFAFSQNPAIDGGVTSPRSRYKEGASVPLNLQVYFEQPLTNLKVIGVAHFPGGGQAPLDFVDDGDASRGDAVAYDGLYSTVFAETKRPGMYRFEVDVESDGSSVAYRGAHERPVEGQEFEYPPIPPFRRRFELTIAVGKERVERPTDPDHLEGHEAPAAT